MNNMDETKRQAYNEFVKSAWEAAVNHKSGEAIVQKEFLTLTDKDGFRHLTSTQKVRHLYTHHGNEGKERNRGQIAITEQDITSIPDIVKDHAFLFKNIKYEGKKAILYAKLGLDNTYIYIEQVSTKKHRNSTATFYNMLHRRDAEGVMTILKNNKLYDLANAEIITGSGGGGHPSDTTQTESRRTVANPVNPADTSLSSSPAEKSSCCRQCEVNSTDAK
jgi:hypothetical protein